MAEEIPSNAVVASEYETKLTFSTIGPVNFTRILLANPRRIAVKFWQVDAGPFPAIFLPGPIPSNAVNTVSQTFPQEYHFRDYPSWLVGEWYVKSDGPQTFCISECLYTRG